MVYHKTAKEVWNKFQSMFSQGNGPRVYQLQKDLASFSQGELSVTEYFTNLSILWDELQNYEPLPTCSCEKCVCNVNENISNIHHREAIMHFLMGRNASSQQQIHHKPKPTSGDPQPPHKSKPQQNPNK